MTGKPYTAKRLPVTEWEVGDYVMLNGEERTITSLTTVGDRVEVELGGGTELGRFPFNFVGTIGTQR